MVGKCNLCLKKNNLQKIAHIIPSFIYRESDLFHEHNNLIKFDLTTFLKTGETKILSYKQKTGEYDKYIICKDCDTNIIGNYESYASKFFFAESLPEGKKLEIKERKGFVDCLNANYSKLKLFFLSILWRASISKRPLFSEINLEKDVEEDIREMILTDNPKKDTDYPIFLMNSRLDKTLPSDYLLHPIQMKVGKEKGFLFGFGGMIVIISLGIKGIPSSHLENRIHESGTISTYLIPPGATWKLITDWYTK